MHASRLFQFCRFVHTSQKHDANELIAHFNGHLRDQNRWAYQRRTIKGSRISSNVQMLPRDASQLKRMTGRRAPPWWVPLSRWLFKKLLEIGYVLPKWNFEGLSMFGTWVRHCGSKTNVPVMAAPCRDNTMSRDRCKVSAQVWKKGTLIWEGQNQLHRAWVAKVASPLNDYRSMPDKGWRELLTGEKDVKAIQETIVKLKRVLEQTA